MTAPIVAAVFADRLWATWSDVGAIVVAAPLIVLAVIAVIRVVGLRSFSKMSSFDFAVTVAIGSVVAGVATGPTPVLSGAVAVAALLATQYVVAVLRRRTAVESVIDNTPRLLMRDGVVFDAAMASSRVTRSDLIAKLREANVLQLSEVRAVVFESTGDMSVLHGDVDVDDELLEGVIRPE